MNRITTPTKLTGKFVTALLALCAATALVAAFADKADAATYSNGFRLSKFKVEVKGWQKTVQQNTHLATDACDADDHSSGAEMVRFKSKPIVITAMYMPGDRNPEFFSGKELGIPAPAVVERSYTPRISYPSPSANCGENGGGVPEEVPQPDCGTKPVSSYGVRLGYGLGKDGQDTLVLNTDSTEDPFERCPGASHGFPRLIIFDNKSDYIGAELSQQELFDPQFQKWISIARGSSKEQTPDYWQKNTIHWEVSFTRLKEKPGS